MLLFWGKLKEYIIHLIIFINKTKLVAHNGLINFLFWQMVALGAVTIFIGDVGDCVQLSSGGVDHRVTSSDHQEGLFGTGISHLGGFLSTLTIGQLVTVAVPSDADVVVLGLLQNHNFLVLPLSGHSGGGGRQGYASGENDELQI